MVHVESGPCDGGIALCFFCTAMLRIEPCIAVLSLFPPLPLSRFCPPPPLNFYFKMPSGPCMSAQRGKLSSASAACPSVPHKETECKARKQKHPVRPLRNDFFLYLISTVKFSSRLIKVWKDPKAPLLVCL